jgi:tetratricopeptide (TPR) repeat protein
MGGVVVLLLVGGGVGWWLWPGGAVAEPPGVPEDLRDPAVREVIEAERRRVLAQPRNGAAWGNLGMTLLAYLYHVQADQCFAEAVRLDPGDARWLYYRGSIAIWLDPSRTLPLLQQAAEIGISSPPEQMTMRLQLADLYLERQQFDAAERLYREALATQADQPRAAYGLGLVLMARGEQREAIRYLKIAATSPYARNRATTQMAMLARQRGEDAVAASMEQKAAAFPPDLGWPDPFLEAVFTKRVGRAQKMEEVEQLEREQRFEEAAARSLQRAEQEPGNPQHLATAGRNFARIGQYERAIGLMKQAIQLAPENCVPYFALARTLHQRAEEEWQRSPGSASARLWFTEAAEAAEQATIRKPDHADAILIRGLCLLRTGQAQQAVAVLQKGVLCRPESFELQRTLGEAYLETGQRKEAATHLENARILKSEDPRLAELLKRLESGSKMP